MQRTDEEIEELFGRQFALEAMLTQLIWAWAKEHRHPPTALAGYLRPIEEAMERMSASPSHRSAAMQAARETVRGIAQELEQTLQRAATQRADDTGPVQ